MRNIGSWGKDIVFKVSSRQILTFRDMTKSISARWANHVPVFGKPIKEFQGVDSDEITMKITLNAKMGVDINKIIKNLEEAVKRGRANYLVIGGRRVGDGKFVITKMSESWDVIIKRGKLFEASIALTFEEYR